MILVDHFCGIGSLCPPHGVKKALSLEDRGRLEKVIDKWLQELAPTFIDLARSDLGKSIMKITSPRDFVFGSMLGLVMIDFVIGTRTVEFTEDEMFEILAVTLKRFKTIDSKIAKPAKKVRTRKK